MYYLKNGTNNENWSNMSFYDVREYGRIVQEYQYRVMGSYYGYDGNKNGDKHHGNKNKFNSNDIIGIIDNMEKN